MIHFATVHYKSARFLDVQKEYVDQNAGDNYKMWVFLDESEDPSNYEDQFHSIGQSGVTEMWSAGHQMKLEKLQSMILEDASDEDLVVFMDGDAWPIADVSEHARQNIDQTTPLSAVQRLENGDRHPHPCFAVAPAWFWRRDDTTWDSGYEWELPNGDTATDTGGELLRLFDESENLDWNRLTRSNGEDQRHFIYFGVYGDLAYHHTCGFRDFNGYGKPTRAHILRDKSADLSEDHKQSLRILKQAKRNKDFWKAL